MLLWQLEIGSFFALVDGGEKFQVFQTAISFFYEGKRSLVFLVPCLDGKENIISLDANLIVIPNDLHLNLEVIPNE